MAMIRINRRAVLLGGSLAALGAMAASFGPRVSSEELGEGELGEELGPFEVELTEAQWRDRLTSEQFYILREHGTERAFTSPLNDEYGAGVFACAGCGQQLYSSDVKYDSHTGWPSFWESLPDAIGTSTDTAFMMVRTECHCSRCGGHLGHIFDDGPPPTGKRHCINGIALAFIAA